MSLIPTNPIAAAATGAMLPLILFTLFFALAIARSPAAARETLLGFFRALGEAMLVLVRWVVALAPIGVFALMLPLARARGVGLAGRDRLLHRGLFASRAFCSRCSSIRWLPSSGGFRCASSRARRCRRSSSRSRSSSSIASLPALVEGAERGLAPSETT